MILSANFLFCKIPIKIKKEFKKTPKQPGKQLFFSFSFQ